MLEYNRYFEFHLRNGLNMENTLTIWRFDRAGEHPAERITVDPTPASLDDATRRLPGGGYTTLRTFGRFRVLRMESHFVRLEETARLAGKPVHLDRAKIRRALHQALAEDPASRPGENVRVRMILDLEQQPGTIYILMDTLRTPDAHDYQAGVKAVTRRLQRENPRAKLTGFIETAAAVRREVPPEMNEAVMIGADGRALEGLSSNFFAVKDGEIWTAEQGVLSGITRSLVLEVIRELGIPVRWEGVRFEDMRRLDEAFITSASRAVLPVTEIDGQMVGDGKPGPITKRVMQGYWERVEEELETI